ncbi:4-hydroxythreonine-4-phosphate dehydrogenase PdxA [Lujinxingia litoralis]|uniref:4-hydroxythreonine-4-phosphate dehydrogenase PdxA n=1 Tax=Lujinxingia litoralis TaxID=2211119 RepID=A0A328C5R4_9DELT|nr:4-hydroxythreonine-4-phosphate dehydrogenase PdxA [Lujinxingia litoralis]RAL22172.1 4-hydroxythreonine-4-phosphate dehydrogenase PdxA [Lujinxingia litoralis]
MSATELSPVRLALTMGDAAGIGPEVIIKTLAELERAGARDLELQVYGSAAVMHQEAAALGYRGRLEVVEVVPELDFSDRPVGVLDARCARAQWAALQQAMAAVDAGLADAIVTAPWNKALFELAQMPVVGHTEVLQQHYGLDEVVMMLGGDRLKVALVTTHVALSEVSPRLSPAAVERVVEITLNGLRRQFGLERPRLAVCGVNPHAGERGHMGREELEWLDSTVAELDQRYGALARISGPWPADTLFAKFGRGQTPYDAVICMYHDQGLIPLKLLHFGESANITLGLPIVRTSVDHGTAYDIAGRGIADAGSMLYATRLAAEMVRRGRAALAS